MAALLSVACARGPEPLPPGLLLQGEVGAARAVLDALQGFEGTPIASAAAAHEARLSACNQIFSWKQPTDQPQADALLRCQPDPALDALPQGHPLAFALPERGPGRLVGWVELTPTLAVAATLDRPVEAGAWGLLLPGEDSPGPLTLSDQDELVHVRARAARVAALSDLVQQGGQGDAMFGLKSGLFAGAVLDGTWEFAAWLPAAGEQLPRAALSVGVRDEGLARAALRGWLEQLERTWNISLTTGIPDLEGCFRALNTLPGLAPCGAIRDNALVVGWNEESLRHALLRPAIPTPVESALARVAMARFPEADRQISLAFAPDEPPPQLRYPWSALELRARRDADALHLRVELKP